MFMFGRKKRSVNVNFIFLVYGIQKLLFDSDSLVDDNVDNKIINILQFSEIVLLILDYLY